MPRAVLGDAITADHAVDRPQVLHLDPAPLSWAVCAGRILGDDAVEPGALVAREPGRRLVRIRGLRRDADRSRLLAMA